MSNPYVFSENIDYSRTTRRSVWGEPDQAVLELLMASKIEGHWLNLASGDGRYNLELLKQADSVVAADINQGALDKLKLNTPRIYSSKLSTVVFDMTQKFPFADKTFNGVFSTGVLHYFPPFILGQIVSEIDRVVNDQGEVIIDFCTDIKRVLPNGKLYIRDFEASYRFDEAINMLKQLFSHYQLDIRKSSVKEQAVVIGDLTYQFSSKLITLRARKMVMQNS